MGFNFTSGKSWKNAGKNLGKKKTWENAGKSTGKWFKDDVGGKQTGQWFKDAGNKTGKGFKSLTDKKTWEGAGNDVKKTWNSASKGIGDSLGGLSDTMSNVMLAGGLLAVVFIGVSFIPEKRRTIEQ